MGTRNMGFCKDGVTRDHPHAYGDKELFKGDENYHEGSSPRVWGQAAVNKANMEEIGIIPTRMGTSIKKHISYFSTQDHPHAYGDKLFCLSTACQALGSSPRVWGQEVVSTSNVPPLRIIPTRMGTSGI